MRSAFDAPALARYGGLDTALAGVEAFTDISQWGWYSCGTMTNIHIEYMPRIDRFIACLPEHGLAGFGTTAEEAVVQLKSSLILEGFANEPQ